MKRNDWAGGFWAKAAAFLLAVVLVPVMLVYGAAFALSYGGELLAAAAGPAVNLILALLLGYGGRLWSPLYLFAGAQLVLGVFNLLPVLPLDGGSLLWNLAAWLTEPYTADRVAGVVGFGVAALLTLAAGAALMLGGSPFLLLAAAGLLWHSIAAIGGCQTAAKQVK
mgnify:CR=1 FL=1